MDSHGWLIETAPNRFDNLWANRAGSVLWKSIIFRPERNRNYTRFVKCMVILIRHSHRDVKVLRFESIIVPLWLLYRQTLWASIYRPPSLQTSCCSQNVSLETLYVSRAGRLLCKVASTYRIQMIPSSFIFLSRAGFLIVHLAHL